MANVIKLKSGTGTPTGGMVKSELAIKHVAANATAANSSMLYIGEDAGDDGVTIRALGTGMTGDSGQGGASIGNSMTFTGGASITTSVSGAAVTIDVTDNTIGAAELNVSGNGSSGQFLSSDGDGTMSWASSSGATLSSTNTFAETQTISKDVNGANFDALVLKNADDDLDDDSIVSLRFDLEDDGGNAVETGRISVHKDKTFDQTSNGSKDGYMVFSTTNNNTLTQWLKLDHDGDLDPITDSVVELGYDGRRFANGYFDDFNTTDLTVTNTISGSIDGTAALATSVTASANNSTNETVYPTFVDGATGTQGIETDTGLNYNPSTGALTTTSVTGNLTGNVTGNASGSSGSCTGNAATATALANARTINGTSFDGTGNITLGNDSVTNAMMADDAIDSDQIASGAVDNAHLAGSIDDSKLSQITTTNKVHVASLDIDGATDIGEALVDADLFIVDNGANSTERKATMSRLKTYMQNNLSFTNNDGDITGVTAGAGLSGGGSSGGVTLAVDVSEFSAVTPASGDSFLTLDSDGSNEQLTTVDALATLLAGTNISASSGVLSATNTTYSEATSSSAGLMSTTHHDKLDGIASNATANAGDITGVTAGTGLSGGGSSGGVTLTVGAAQTTITSMYATDLILGEDSSTAIDFGTANEIDFKADGSNRLTLTASALYPETDNEIDLGTSSLQFKDGYFDGTLEADSITCGGADIIQQGYFTPTGPASGFAAGTNAAIGYTSIRGLYLTGQGSSTDISITNDTGAEVLKVPTGTQNIVTNGRIQCETIRLEDSIGQTTIVNADTDTDKFLVLDSSNNVDFRTGSQVRSDIGAGDITNVSVSSPITGGGSSGSVTIGLDDPINLSELTEGTDATDDKILLWDESTSGWKYMTLDNLQDSIDTTGGGGGGGSGTVNSGTDTALAHYASTGTAVSDTITSTASLTLDIDGNLPELMLYREDSSVSGTNGIARFEMGNTAFSSGRSAPNFQLQTQSGGVTQASGSEGGCSVIFKTIGAGESTLTTRFKINSDGEVLDADGEGAFVKYMNLQGSPSIMVNQAGHATFTFELAGSDERIKHKRRTFDYGLKEIEQLKPEHYKYNKEVYEEFGFSEQPDKHHNEEHQGLMAQDIESIMPELVYEINDTGVKNYNRDGVMSALVNAVKELSARVAELEGEKKDV